jgi:hypothetical protein
VLDYSAVERLGRAEEYAETMISHIPSFHALSKDAQNIERKRYMDEAQATAKGCATHFSGSVLRIKHMESLVPPERLQEFDSLIHQLMSPDTTTGEFDRVAQGLSAQFPRVKNWLTRQGTRTRMAVKFLFIYSLFPSLSAWTMYGYFSLSYNL